MSILKQDSERHDYNSCQKSDLQSTFWSSGIPRKFVREGVQQILLRTEDR